MKQDQLMKLIELKMLAERQTLIKGDPGEKGDPGYNPEKGKDYLTPEEVQQFKLDVVETITPQIEKFIMDTVPSHEKSIEAIIERVLEEVEDGDDGEDAEVDYETIYATVIERLKPEIPTIEMLLESVSHVTTPESLRDKLESLEGDERLDKSAIKGLETVIDQDTMDRAISILDQRTQFLINRPSSDSGGGTSIGGTITGGTSGSVLFVNPDATISQNNTYFNYNDTTHTLTVPTVVSAGVEWTGRTAAAANTWFGLTYGNGLFVAVSSSGTGNRVMTSPDGVNWTSRTSAADNNWTEVTYGNGLFVAVSTSGTGNRVMTSPEGITWTSRTSAADLNWQGIAYGNGVFVAVSTSGTGNRVMTSPDGVTWTSRTSAADLGWRDVTYGNGLFVAVAESGTGNRVMTSPDGITWTSRASANDSAVWASVVYGNGQFVSVGGTGAVMTSPDGITWTLVTAPNSRTWAKIAYGNGLFVAIARTVGGNRVMTSQDGITWISRPSADDTYAWYGLAYGNGMFVATNVNSVTTTGVMTSGYTIEPSFPSSGATSTLAEVSADSTTSTTSTYTMTSGVPVHYKYSDTTTALYIDETNKRFGFNTSSPLTAVEIQSASSDPILSQLSLTDSSALATGNGGGFTFRGVYNSGGATTSSGGIRSYKTNATSGNYGYGMAFYTRTNGTGNLGSPKMFIDDSGNVGVNTTTPSALFDVYHTSAANIYASSNAGSMGLTFNSTYQGSYLWKYWFDRLNTLSLKWDYNGSTMMSLTQAGGLTIAGGLAFNGDLNLTINSILGNINSKITVYDNSTGNMILRANTFSTAISQIKFQTGTSSTDRMIIDGSGNVILSQNTRLNFWNSFGSYIKAHDGTGSAATSNSNGLLYLSSLVPTVTGADNILSNLQGDATQTSGERSLVYIPRGFSPTSGTGTYNSLKIQPIINQTGGANGVTRGIYISPFLTAAADFRGLELANNSGYGVYQSGASAKNYFAGNTGIGFSSPYGNLQTKIADAYATGANFTTSDWVTSSTGSGVSIRTGASTGNTWTSLQALTGGASTVGVLSLNPVGGNVGIGTTTPNAKLEVSSGDIYVFGGTDRRVLIGDSASGGQYGGFRWQSADDSISFGHSNSSANLRNIVVESDGDILLNSSNTGNVGIGTTSPSARIHGISTTEQLRLGYDVSNYYSTTISSTGGVTFDAVGSGSAFTFSDDVSVPDEAYGSGWNGSLEVPTKNAVYDKIETIGGSSAITVIPQSVVPLDTASNSPTFTATVSGSPTVALIGQVVVPQAITVNKVTIKVQSTDSDNSKLALYSQDGQTKYIDETFDTTSTAMVTNTLGSPVTLSAGIYYVAYTCQDATGGPGIWAWDTSWGTGGAYDIYSAVSGEPITEGYMTISSFTMPATFNPTSAITAGQSCTALFRLDN